MKTDKQRLFMASRRAWGADKAYTFYFADKASRDAYVKSHDYTSKTGSKLFDTETARELLESQTPYYD